VGREPLPWNTFLIDSVGAQADDNVFVARPQEMSSSGFDFFKVYRLNTVNGRDDELDVPTQSRHWVVDPAGELRVAVVVKGAVQELHVRAGGAQAWRKISEGEAYTGQGAVWPVQLMADGTLYVVTAPKGQDHLALHTMDMATGQVAAKPVIAADGFDLRPSFIASDKALLGLRYEVDGEVTSWLDTDLANLQKLVDNSLKATNNRISVPRRGDSPWVLIEAASDQQPAISFSFNRKERKLLRLGEAMPRIKAPTQGQMDFVRIKARDGLEMPAYLTVPAGAERKALPLVLWVHGGPWARGGHWRWDAELQFLASRGYAVLQPEFRGSTGFGRKHFEAGWKQWGQAMQNDLADAARWAIAQGIADPKRIAIAGASYGGYAALMGVIRDAELFRCAVSWVGPTDLELLHSARWSDISPEFKLHGFGRLVGDPATESAMLRNQSPLRQAEKVAAPVLLAYGGVDRRVPVEHGRRMRDALKAANKPHEYHEYPSEGHGWATLATRVDFWGRVEAFLGQHLRA
jgi:dienelactone hydrolase